jgi:septal ring factor EnvC (AmiA/AmiB activator)
MNSTTPDRGNVAQADVSRTQFAEQFLQLLGDVPPDDRSDSETVAPAPWRLPDGWALRGILLAACLGLVTLFCLQLSSGDTAKTTTAAATPAPPAQTATEDVAPTAALLLQLTKQTQSISLDLATLARRVEQIEATQDRLRDDANVANQFKASQEQMTGVIAKLSEQLNASQEQISRNNAEVAEQLKASQEQLVRVLAQAEQDRQKIAASQPPPPSAAPARRPAPPPASPQTAAQARAQKPQPPSKPPSASPLGFLSP